MDEEEQVASALAVIREFCDESDCRYYKSNGELHAVLPKTWVPILTEKLQTMGWQIKWTREKIREYESGETWDRLAFTHTD